MAVVDTWDGANRRIYLASGVTEFHPIDDICREYREARRLDESFRVWDPFMVAVGNDPKGGGRYTSRYLLLLSDDPFNVGPVKIIPFDQGGEVYITGEVLTDDQTSPFDISTLTQAVVMVYTPPDTEIIRVSTTGVPPELETAIDNIDANIALIQTDISTINVAVAAQLALLTGIEERDIAEHITNPATGKLEIVNDDAQRRWVADAWENLAKTEPYRGQGLEVVGTIVEIAY